MRGRTQRAQREYGGERKRRRSYAEVAEGIPKLFGKGLNQCLCGLQGINGWEGVWGLVVGVFTALLCVGWKDTGQRRKRRRGYAEVAEGTPNCLKRLASSIHAGCRPKMAGKAHGCWLLGFCRSLLQLLACAWRRARHGGGCGRQGLDASAADFLPVYFLQFAAHDWLAAYGAGLRGFHFGFGWQLGGYFGDGK